MPETDITEESNGALVVGLADAKRELFNLRFQRATGQLENNARMGQVRKQIARINTEIRTREIAAADALEAAARAQRSEGES